MGLAAPKKRLKLSHDPNNTAWTGDPQSFGRKLMTSQGWQPGQFLGVKDAAHAEFHTAANASHIRVMVKDDNLGVGAKIGSGVGHGECTGLDVFKDILGRLNGKEEDELEKEKKSREDLKRAIYTERKWGSIRFVQGGFLIGDKIQHLIDGEAERIRKLAEGSMKDTSASNSETELEDHSRPTKNPKKIKKRKVEAIEGALPEAVVVKTKKLKRREKSRVSQEKDAIEPLDEAKSSKKSKSTRHKEENDSTADDDSNRKRRKKEKKEERKRKEKESDSIEKDITSNDLVEAKSTKKSKRDRKTAAQDTLPISSEPSQVSTKESTPSISTPNPSSGRSTPLMQGRHAVRSRNIAQKRLASMDVASLNQIFMIKS